MTPRGASPEARVIRPLMIASGMRVIVRSSPDDGATCALPLGSSRKPGFLDDPNGRAHVAPSSGDDLTITLIPEAIIKGRITLASGDAPLGVMVQLFSRQVREGLPRWTP